MVYELEREQFHRCRDFVNRGANIESKAIVAGHNPGRIFVDDAENPQTAMIWQGNLDGFNFVGHSCNHVFNREILPFIENIIKPQAAQLGVEWFECIGDHPSWYTAFEEECFKNRDLVSFNQRVYALDQQDWRNRSKPVLGEGYTIQRVTRELLRSRQLRNLEMG